MPKRSRILRIMLGLLGIAALTGVSGVLFLRTDLMWRMIGSELSAAVACGLILLCIPMIDQARKRAAGLLGIVGVTLEFILAIVLIWELPNSFLGVRCEGELAGTMLLWGFALIVSMPLLTLTHQKAHVVTAWTGTAVFGVSTVVWLLALWLHQIVNYSEDIYRRIDDLRDSGIAVLVMGALISLCLLGLGDPPRRVWRWAGVVGAFIAGAMWLYDIWVGAGSPLGRVIFGGLIGLAAAITYAIVCLLCPLKPPQLWFRKGTILAAAITAAFAELLVIQEQGFFRGLEVLWISRCTAAAGIVTACGTLALVVLARMNRGIDAEPDSLVMTDVTVICPRCRKKQSLAIGEAVCSGCQLRISIRVEEPRCKMCDYLLIGLTSDCCPECGTAI